MRGQACNCRYCGHPASNHPSVLFGCRANQPPKLYYGHSTTSPYEHSTSQQSRCPAHQPANPYAHPPWARHVPARTIAQPISLPTHMPFPPGHSTYSRATAQPISLPTRTPSHPGHSTYQQSHDQALCPHVSIRRGVQRFAAAVRAQHAAGLEHRGRGGEELQGGAHVGCCAGLELGCWPESMLPA